MILRIIRSIIECFCGKKRGAEAKKKDDFQSNDHLDSLEAGGGGGDDGGDDFESWDAKPAAKPPPVERQLQKLDDFDGMAAPKKVDASQGPEPDFFGGMSVAYMPPKQIDVSMEKSKPKAPVLGLDDDDVDLDSWETGTTKKTKKSRFGATKI